MEKTKKIYGEYELEIWDTAGREKYRIINPTQIKTADIIFLCFDNNISSYTYIQNSYNEIKQYVNNNAIFILLCLKCELLGTSDINPYNEIGIFVKNKEIYYSETSIYYNDDYIYKEFNFDSFIEDNTLKDECVTFRNFKDNIKGGSKYSSNRSILKLGTLGDNNTAIKKVDSLNFNNKLYEDNLIYYRGGVNIVVEYAISLYERKNKISGFVRNETFKFSTKDYSNIDGINISVRKENAKCCMCKTQ